MNTNPQIGDQEDVNIKMETTSTANSSRPSPLEENSLFVMKARLQSTHYHRVHCGRNDPALRECGIRWIPHSDVTPSAPPQELLRDFRLTTLQELLILYII